ncbi:MAG: thioredoxin fold domain-containing protein [Desulfobacteraceae bacterium]|nr:thioredoxin fold domain-containing protein [Desulfobacteraceae bacterium]
MRKENILVVLLVGIALLAGWSFINKGNSGTQDETKIQWKTYDQGLALASEQNKNIFLYFHADWCTFCQKLKSTTFKDNNVVQFLNEKFIPIIVDTDVDKMLAASFGVKGLPTMWFLKSDTGKISNLPGYVDEKQLMKILKYIDSLKYETMSFQEFIKTL